MSSLSNSPHGKILDYWYKKLQGNENKFPFLATKIIEIFAFKTKSTPSRYLCPSIPFPTNTPNPNNISKKTSVSVVIPALITKKREYNNLKALITSIQQQSRKPNHIIIIDDCSPISYNIDREIIFQRLEKKCGPARARNIGKEIAKNLKSEIIAFTDADCIVDKHWIKTIMREFMKIREAHILSGNTISYDKHWFGEYHNINGTLNGRKFKESNKLLYGTTANLAITLEVCNRVNFNESFTFSAGEDIEFCFRANKKGFVIRYVPEMLVKHNYGYTSNRINSLRKFTKQFLKYGQGEKILLEHVPEYYAFFNETEEISAREIFS